MDDPLWDDHPRVKKIREESEMKTWQEAVVNVVRARFPELTEQAKKIVEQLNNSDTLKFLLMELSSAADATVARHILHPSAV